MKEFCRPRLCYLSPLSMTSLFLLLVPIQIALSDLLLWDHVLVVPLIEELLAVLPITYEKDCEMRRNPRKSKNAFVALKVLLRWTTQPIKSILSHFINFYISIYFLYCHIFISIDRLLTTAYIDFVFIESQSCIALYDSFLLLSILNPYFYLILFENYLIQLLFVYIIGLYVWNSFYIDFPVVTFVGIGSWLVSFYWFENISIYHFIRWYFIYLLIFFSVRWAIEYKSLLFEHVIVLLVFKYLIACLVFKYLSICLVVKTLWFICSFWFQVCCIKSLQAVVCRSKGLKCALL
jgi:hypothetical protein